MATLTQLLKLDEQIRTASERLNEKKIKRGELVKQLALDIPSWSERKAQNFVMVNDKPHILWVDAWGDLELEELTFQ